MTVPAPAPGTRLPDTRLVFVSEAPRGLDTRRQRRWRCRCDCGQEAIVYRTSVLRGNTRSCGCLRAELAAERCRRLKGQPTPKATRPRPSPGAASLARGRATRAAVLAAVVGGATKSIEIARKIDKTPDCAQRHLRALRAEGLVEPGERGRWRPVPVREAAE